MDKSMKKYTLISVFVLIFIMGILYITVTNKEQQTEYKTPLPEEVVKQYFNAWSNKNYPDMYAAISDGFKKIELTAKDLGTFRNFVESQGVGSIEILSIKEASNDGKTATVDYSVYFLNQGGKKTKFDGTFTLKYRQGDIIPGWKLIHPYGENIDTS